MLYFQVLHQDIESHSQLIKTVKDQCAQLAEQHRKKYKHRKQNSAISHKRISILLSVGKIIEKRWHCLWLRSLEWQCFLEQFTSCSLVRILFCYDHFTLWKPEVSDANFISFLQFFREINLKTFFYEINDWTKCVEVFNFFRETNSFDAFKQKSWQHCFKFQASSTSPYKLQNSRNSLTWRSETKKKVFFHPALDSNYFEMNASGAYFE